MGDRWATFDCYGTLVDWNAGIGGQLDRLLGSGASLERYHEVEPAVQSDDPTRSYRDVLARTLAELATEAGVELPREEEDALAHSLPDWPVFPDARPALEQLRADGWRLGILSNCDRDLLEASVERIGVPFDLLVLATEVGSYKPNPGHWERFFVESGAEPDRTVHVAQSHFHDIVAAAGLGLSSVWINRLAESPGPPRPTRELPDLTRLPETVAELVP